MNDLQRKLAGRVLVASACMCLNGCASIDRMVAGAIPADSCGESVGSVAVDAGTRSAAVANAVNAAIVNDRAINRAPAITKDPGPDALVERDTSSQSPALEPREASASGLQLGISGLQLGMIDETPFRLASDRLPSGDRISGDRISGDQISGDGNTLAVVNYSDEQAAVEEVPAVMTEAAATTAETSEGDSSSSVAPVASSNDAPENPPGEKSDANALGELLSDATDADATDADRTDTDSIDEEILMDDVPRLLPPPTFDADAANENGLPLQAVVASVQSFFPLLEVAYLERSRTAGDQLAAWGNFDTKIKGRTENQPLGFYENYQHGGGVYQPLYNGADVYGGYRVGRGEFEPWYLERETNRGGEFKTGFQMPLLKDSDIDARRAELWRATYDRQLAEPAIRQEVINTIRDATITYWVWVAAGQQYRIGEAALELAERRNQQIKRRVETGDLAEPSLADNRRAIIQRRGKLIDLERKLIQSAVKLSLFLRTDAAVPYTPSVEELSYFPQVIAYDATQVTNDITYAVRNRPELVSLDTLARRVQVDLAEAYNDTLPTLDAISNISQDVGERTSSKGDKSEFEIEIGLEFEMPVQRRKGFGKMRSARAKINQIVAKRQFTVEKISIEVQNAVAALDAAYERVQAITDAVEISEKLAAIERRKFELGESDLLAVFLREQIAIEAASDLMVAKLEYFIARADYTAALAYEFPVLFVAPTEQRNETPDVGPANGDGPDGGAS